MLFVLEYGGMDVEVQGKTFFWFIRKGAAKLLKGGGM